MFEIAKYVSLSVYYFILTIINWEFRDIPILIIDMFICSKWFKTSWHFDKKYSTSRVQTMNDEDIMISKHQSHGF